MFWMDVMTRLNEIGNKQTNDQSNGGNNFKINNCLAANPSHFLHITCANNSKNNSKENDRNDHHPDHIDENIADKFCSLYPASLLVSGQIMNNESNKNSEKNSNDDLHIKN